jgi:hypothetical protein
VTSDLCPRCGEYTHECDAACLRELKDKYEPDDG